jgi:hypothetical protein
MSASDARLHIGYGDEMAFTFDSLSYAKHLRDHGIPQGQAEAHAKR